MTFDERLERCVTCDRPLAPFDVADHLGLELRYDVCTWCGVVQMNPRPSADELAHHYEQAYWAGTADEDRSNTTPVQRARAAQQEAFACGSRSRHLDVGCSSGTLLTHFDAPVQVGVEPGLEHRRGAEAAGIEVHASLEALAATGPEPFDLITMSHVLEHLPDPLSDLRAVRDLLAPHGEVIVEVPYLYRSLAYEPAHLLAFDERSLAATLRTAGLEVTRSRRHRGRQGSLGIGRNLAVAATVSRPRPPVDQHRRVWAMRLRRRVGFAPQQLYRWRNRTGRRLRKRLVALGRR